MGVCVGGGLGAWVSVRRLYAARSDLPTLPARRTCDRREPAEVAAEMKEFAETKGVAEKGDAKAQHHLAYLLEEGLGTKPDATEAAKWCRKSAEQGYADAQYALSFTFLDVAVPGGGGTVRQD